LNIQPNLPPALGDETRITQIISILFDNAHKYTPERGQLILDLAPATKVGLLQISVADNGVGIAPADRDKLFEPFFRAKSALQTEANGTGLGLYIARALAQLHGGQLWFESELNRGSTFYLTLPAANQSQ
jgi:signal transduction histidine kinase